MQIHIFIKKGRFLAIMMSLEVEITASNLKVFTFYYALVLENSKNCEYSCQILKKKLINLTCDIIDIID